MQGLDAHNGQAVAAPDAPASLQRQPDLFAQNADTECAFKYSEHAQRLELLAFPLTYIAHDQNHRRVGLLHQISKPVDASGAEALKISDDHLRALVVRKFDGVVQMLKSLQTNVVCFGEVLCDQLRLYFTGQDQAES